MINKETRKRLMDQKPLDFSSKSMSNHTATWNRLKDHVTKATRDSVLIYKKLDSEKRSDLYNIVNFKELLEVLLEQKTNDMTKLELANFTLERAVKLFKNEFLSNNKNASTITKDVCDNLDKCIEICEDITYNEKLKRSLMVDSNKKRYLCRFSEISKREKNRFSHFMVHVLDIPPFELMLIPSSSKKQEILGTFKDEEGLKQNLKLYYNYLDQKMTLAIKKDKDYEVVHTFITEKENNDYILYYGAIEINKLKEFNMDLD